MLPFWQKIFCFIQNKKQNRAESDGRTSGAKIFISVRFVHKFSKFYSIPVGCKFHMYWFTARTTPNYLYRVKQKKTKQFQERKVWNLFERWRFEREQRPWLDGPSEQNRQPEKNTNIFLRSWQNGKCLKHFFRQNFKDILIQLNENVLSRLNFNYARFIKVNYFWPCRNRCRPCRWLADACRTWRRWRLLSTEPAGIDHRRRTSLEKSKSKTKHKSSDKIAFPNFRDSKFSKKKNH